MDSPIFLSLCKSFNPNESITYTSRMITMRDLTKLLFSILIVIQTYSRVQGSQSSTMISIVPNTSSAIQLSLENFTDYPTGNPSNKVDLDLQQSETVKPTHIVETLITKEPFILNETNTGKIFTTIINNNEETSTLDALIGNYDATENLIDVHETSSNSHDSLKYIATSEELDDIGLDDIVPRKTSYSAKTRRQADNYRDPVDWWVNLTAKSPTKGVKSSNQPSEGTKKKPTHVYKTQKKQPAIKDSSHKGSQPKPKRFVYKEQPLNQNIIITIKYQLSAIKLQHKTLVTRSMRQLQQLDNRLIESYKLCLKKKNPLYAGMLYRTRDFVTKMAKEVKIERNVLESMTKQVQTVLNQKMTNRTIVREYNKLMAAPTEFPLNSRQSRTNSFDEVQTRTGQQQHTLKVVTSKITSTIRTKKDSLIHIQDSELQINTTDDCKHSKIDEQEREESGAIKKAKLTKYTVSVNEVNLKKRLNKVQALIDRINGSCYELTQVVEDINFLFKLIPDAGIKKMSSILASYKNSATKSEKGHQNELSMDSIYMMLSDQKRNKMLKSPSKVLFEKYGKLVPSNQQNVPITTTNSSRREGEPDFTTILPEMKPLFDSSSFVYKEVSDLELGVS